MKKSTKGVLVLDGTPRVVIAICRSLHAHGIPAVAAQIGRRAASLSSNAVVADVALANIEPAFFEDLKRLLSGYELDTVVPCSDKALRSILPHYEELSTRAHLTCPEPRILKRVLDKSETLRIAQECGIAIPETYTIRDLATLHAIQPRLRFPIIAKPVNAGTPSPFKIQYFRTLDELEFFVRHSDAPGTVFQEFLPGEGVGIAGIVDQGGPLALFQHQRLHEWPARGGVGVLLKSQALEPQLADAARALLQRLEWRGPAMVEFRRDPLSGKYALMEVNGRFWGSLPLAIEAGLDMPYFQWQLLHGVHPDVPAAYKLGLKMRWTTGELRRLVELTSDPEARRVLGYKRLTPVLQFITAFDPQVRSALFSARDPWPAIREVAQYLAMLGVGIAWAQVKRTLPGATRRLLQLRYLERKQRKIYVALWLMRGIGLRRAPSAAVLKDFRKVTFVCRGNRIRSPLAAAVLASRLNGLGRAFEIASAGTAVVSGGAFDERAKRVADSMGLDFSGRSQSVTAALVNSSDLLVVMDHIIEAELVTQFPRAATKVVLLSDMLSGGQSESGEIPDPDRFTDAEFSRCLSHLIASVESMADRFA